MHLPGMTSSSFPRGRLVALIAAGIVLLILIGVGIYGLLTGPRPTTPEPGTTPAPTVTTPTVPHPGSPRLPVVPRSADPEVFARNVAEAVFAWDTTSGLMPLDYTAVVLDVGDPSGTEQAGLAADLAAYLPTREAWIELRKHETRQHLTIDRAYVPDAWAEAVAQAQPGQIAAGTTAITIEGTRHRAGVWNGDSVASEHPVAFTVFVLCPDSSGSCSVLRLSQLDNPLR